MIVLKKKYTKNDSEEEILDAIQALGADKSGRVLMSEHCEWLEQKLGEVKRLSRILINKQKSKRPKGKHVVIRFAMERSPRGEWRMVRKK